MYQAMYDAGVGPAKLGKKRKSMTGEKLSPKQIAQMLQIKEKQRFPRDKFGVAHILRGSPWSLEQYGTTYKQANDRQRMNRRETGYVGRGKYSFGKGIRDTFKYAGAAKRLLGMGGYSGMDSANSNALFSGNDTDTISITHSEYLQDIVPTSANFQTVYSALINPGLGVTFPWLSQVAQYYEEYRFNQLVFEFKTTVAPGNSSASGSIIFATQYNPTNALYTGKQAMENAFASNSFSMAQSGVHGVECDPSKEVQDWEYIRTGAVPSGQDQKSYDKALVQVATAGASPNLNVGELWVTYSVQLRKVKILAPGQVISNTLSDTWKQTAYNNANTPLGNDTGVPFTDGLLPYAVNNASGSFLTGGLGFRMGVATVSTAVRNELIFPAGISGRYLVTLYFKHSAGTIGSWSTLMTQTPDATNGPFYANCSLVVFPLTQVTYGSNLSTDTDDSYTFLVDVVGNPSNVYARVRFPGFTVSSGTNASVAIAQVPTTYRII